MPRDAAAQRERMVERQLRRRGIADERVLAAMGKVPRELFVPEPERRRAYRDGALPIGHGQTISQPWIVAAIAQALATEGDERVLDVGSGSGYSVAVLAELAAEVIGIERVEALAERSRAVLAELGVGNAEIIAADGSEGRPERAPFDAIAVHATAPAAPAALLGQLAIGGRLVVPIATDRADMLTVFRRTAEEIDPATGAGLEAASLGATRFVPLIGRAGFNPDG
ncbi:MAG TPA: protein-L-isoaspartate(D-aspartate) O-methyltransferase [Solirubrobacterales bacterium]